MCETFFPKCVKIPPYFKHISKFTWSTTFGVRVLYPHVTNYLTGRIKCSSQNQMHPVCIVSIIWYIWSKSFTLCMVSTIDLLDKLLIPIQTKNLHKSFLFGDFHDPNSVQADLEMCFSFHHSWCIQQSVRKKPVPNLLPRKKNLRPKKSK